MILYFSATGNSRYVATTLAKKLDDECVDLAKRMHAGDTSPIFSSSTAILSTASSAAASGRKGQAPIGQYYLLRVLQCVATECERGRRGIRGRR